MKKNSKFVFGLLSVAAIAGGAYYYVKNILNKDSDDDFEDFEDDFEDFDFDEDEDEEITSPSEGREYVTLNITTPEVKDEAKEDACTCETTAEAVEEAVECEAEVNETTTEE